MLTSTQLRRIRTDRHLTRAAMAAVLGCTAHQLVHWESGERKIPNWVEEKVFGTLSITLPLADLQTLMVHAQTTGEDLSDLLTHCIREYLKTVRQPTVHPNPENNDI